MSAQTIKVLIAGALLLHGLGHTGALGALIAHSRGHFTGFWRPARSWLFPSLAAPTARRGASIFWGLSTLGFVAASMSFWGILVPGEAWRQLAVVSSIVSTLGIALFLGTWPALNTIAALAMNIAVLVTQLWLHWPPLGFIPRSALHQRHHLLLQAVQPVDDPVDQPVGGRQARLERQQPLQAGRVLPGQPRLKGARRGVCPQPAPVLAQDVQQLVRRQVRLPLLIVPQVVLP
jgi:hypothetical protein